MGLGGQARGLTHLHSQLVPLNQMWVLGLLSSCARCAHVNMTSVRVIVGAVCMMRAPSARVSAVVGAVCMMRVPSARVLADSVGTCGGGCHGYCADTECTHAVAGKWYQVLCTPCSMQPVGRRKDTRGMCDLRACPLSPLRGAWRLTRERVIRGQQRT